MVIYSCEKCGKEFSQKGHYTKHLNRKNPCVVESKVKEILDKVVEDKLENIKLSVNDNYKKEFDKNIIIEEPISKTINNYVKKNN